MGNNEFIVDDGYKEYVFKNTHGIVFGKFFLNATDTSIVQRTEKAMEEYNKIVFDDKNGSFDDIIRAEEKIMTCFNTMFGRDMKEELFSMYRPLTLFVNGQFYCEYIFDCICNTINQEFDARLQTSKAKVKKATKKYTK